jgi:hypothetical protein
MWPQRSNPHPHATSHAIALTSPCLPLPGMLVLCISCKLVASKSVVTGLVTKAAGGSCPSFARRGPSYWVLFVNDFVLRRPWVWLCNSAFSQSSSLRRSLLSQNEVSCVRTAFMTNDGRVVERWGWVEVIFLACPVNILMVSFDAD